MNYPLTMSFKIVALAPQIFVRDASGATLCYVKQKLLKLKERIEVFTDETKKTRLCEIAADRIIDWSAAYHFTDSNGNVFGGVRRKGMRSLWKAHYEILRGDEVVMRIKKEPAFWEGKFKLEKLSNLEQLEEFPVVFSLLTMLLLERSRG